MIINIHIDDNSIKLTNLWHSFSLFSAKLLRTFDIAKFWSREIKEKSYFPFEFLFDESRQDSPQTNLSLQIFPFVSVSLGALPLPLVFVYTRRAGVAGSARRVRVIRIV